MYKVYSKNGEPPQSLPFRIYVADGSSRTNPSTFTDEDLAEAGYFAVEVPEYELGKEQLSWNGTTYDVIPVPPISSEEE